MKNTTKPQQQPGLDTLESLCDAYNAGNLTVDEMVRRSAPILRQQRLEEIVVIMCQLFADNPGRYHHDNRDALWEHAERLYSAKIDLFFPLKYPKGLCSPARRALSTAG